MKNLSKSFYEGTRNNNNLNYWTVRATYDAKAKALSLVDTSKNSLTISKEQIIGTCQISPQHMLVHLFMKDLLLYENWEPVRRINEPDASNIEKYILPMESFDYEEFPFVILTGVRSLNILNVKTGFMQPLINLVIWTKNGMETAFVKQDKAGISLHFCNFNRDDDNQRFDNWYCLSLK